MQHNKLFIVALHTQNQAQVFEQAGIILENGADGIILVNNGGILKSSGESPNIFSVAVKLKQLYPETLIGINPLGIETIDALTYVPSSLDFLWVDNGGIEEAENEAFLNRDIAFTLERAKPNYLGSVLFKYQPQPINPEKVVMAAAKHFHAVITSGEATGSAPAIEKIQQIREWIGPYAKLGIASGMSSENVTLFLPYVDMVIVATSLCQGDGKGENFFLYDGTKIRDFRDRIDTFERTLVTEDILVVQ